MAFDPQTNTSNLDGTIGFVISGENDTDSGFSVSEAGDVNGDGFDDLIIGAPLASASGYGSEYTPGAAYVVFGGNGGFASNISLASLDGTNGFKIIGDDAFGNAGYSVSGAGDFNGDGFDDVIVGVPGAYGATYYAGAAYIVYGFDTTGTSPSEIFLADVESGTTDGLVLNGSIYFSGTGYSVDGAGDVNGDDFDDVIVGTDTPAGYNGTSYVVFGGNSFGTSLDLSTLNDNTTLNDNNGFIFDTSDEPFGMDVSGAGDVNGDGFADLIVGAWDVGTPAGEVHVIFGTDQGFPAWLTANDLNGYNGFTISSSTLPVSTNTYLGFSVDGAGDVNGDGIDDLIFSGIGLDELAYVIFGRSDFSTSIDLANLSPSDGFAVTGFDAVSDTPVVVSGVGDVNGDGIDDFAVGVSYSEYATNYGGETYIIFGTDQGLGSTVDVSTLDGNNGFTLSNDEFFNYLGRSVSSAGDINGDGIDDLAAGAPYTGYNYNGSTFVVFGQADEPQTANFSVLTANRKILLVKVIETGAGVDLELSVNEGTVLNLAAIFIDLAGTPDGTFPADVSLTSDNPNVGVSGSFPGSFNGISYDYALTFSSLAAGTVSITPENPLTVSLDEDGSSVRLDIDDFEGANFVVNQSPEITSLGGGDEATISVDENSPLLVTDVDSIDDRNSEGAGNGLNYTITGGADSSRFSIATVTGQLFLNNSLDFENPIDDNGDNNYEVEVTVTDRNGAFDTQQITVSVQDVNEPPVITSDGGGPTALVDVDENTTFVTDVESEDDFYSEGDGYGLSYSLTGGTDAALFDIDPSTGELTFIDAPDFENPTDGNGDNDYEVEVTVTDSGNLTDSQGIIVTVTNVIENADPDITSDGGGATAAVSVDENTTFVTDVNATDDLDSEGEGLTYTITGGADANEFIIDSTTGGLNFEAPPDFETPFDDDSNNDYEVQVTVTDSNGGTDTQDITVTVEDVNENADPIITSNGGGNTATVLVAENTVEVTDVNAVDDLDDEGEGLTYEITGGADAGLFQINPQTGELTFVTAPDFENPGDADGDNVYEVQVTVTDSNDGTDTQNLFVNVVDLEENADPIITSDDGGDTATVLVAENTVEVTDVNAVDLIDAEGEGLTYEITGGADAGLFQITTQTGLLSLITAPDFENPGDGNLDNDYEVEVTVTDSGGLTDTQAITVTVVDVEENADPIITSDGGGDTAAVSVAENTLVVTDVNAIDDADSEGEGLLYSITGGVDSEAFSIDPNSGELSFNAAPDFENPTDANNNNDYEVQVTVTDSEGGSDMQDVTVTVTDEPDTPPLAVTVEKAFAGSDLDSEYIFLEEGTTTSIDNTFEITVTGSGGPSDFVLRDLATDFIEFTNVTVTGTANDVTTLEDLNNDGKLDLQSTVTNYDGSPITYTVTYDFISTGYLANITLVTEDPAPSEDYAGVVFNGTVLFDEAMLDPESPDGEAFYQGILTNTAEVDVGDDGNVDATATDEVNVAIFDISGILNNGSAAQFYSNQTLAIEGSWGFRWGGFWFNESDVDTSGEPFPGVVEAVFDTDIDLSGSPEDKQQSIENATGEFNEFIPDQSFLGLEGNLQQVEVPLAGGAVNPDPTTVQTSPPIITTPTSVSVAENQTLALDVNSTDLDGDTEGAGLTYALTGGVDAGLFDIDSDTGEVTFINPPDFENPTDNGGDNVYNVQVTVTDSDSLTSAKEFAIAVTDDTETVTNALEIGLFDTDTDTLIAVLEEGSQISASLLEGRNVTIAATVPNGSALSGQVESARLNLNQGQITQTENVEPYALYGDRKGDFFRGEPIPLGNNSLIFELYSENKAQGQLVDTITVNFTIVEDPSINLPPVAVDDDFTVSADQMLSGDVSVNDSDPNGDDLTFTLDQGTHNGTLIFNTDGTFNYTPNQGFTGTDSFTYDTSDGEATDSATVDILINPASQADSLQLGLYDTHSDELIQTVENGSIISTDLVD
jgi:hypothetical protein